MRGDSLRDLYAKSIALLGLGLLGAIGAAVDYWPTSLAIPRTAAVDRRVPGARPLPAGKWSDVTEAAPFRAVSVTVAARPATHLMQSAAFRTVTFIPQAPAPVKARLELAPPATFTGLASTPDAEIELADLDQSQVFQITTIAEAPASDQKSAIGGFFSPIVDGSRQAGAAVASGVQAAAGAMRAGALKLWPFGRHDEKPRNQMSGLFSSGLSYSSR